MAKEKRFIKTYQQGSLVGMQIWVDRVTGVNYLFHYDGYAGGMTPLIDVDGQPIVTPLNDDLEYEEDEK